MTKLNAEPRQHHRQVTFTVDQQRGVVKAESMSSLSDVSDVSPPPDDDVDNRLISRVYGVARKPTTIALTFRPPRKQRLAADRLPKLVAKTTKPKGRRRPGNVTSPTGDAASYHSDDSHVTSGRQNNRMVASKSMHSLSKTHDAVNRSTTLPSANGTRTRTVTTLLERRQAMASPSEVKPHRTNDRLLSAERIPNHSSNTNAARSNSVIN